MRRTIALICLSLFSLLFMSAMDGCAKKRYPKDAYIVRIRTSKGDMVVRLDNDTPLHRDNFIKLVNEKFYDGLAFHRVIKDFMIQTGDPETRHMHPDSLYGKGGPGYTVPSEIRNDKFHIRGALAAARQGDQVNPERRSSGSQFYIIQGKRFTDEELNQMESSITHRNRYAVANAAVQTYYTDSIESLRKLSQEEMRAKLNAVGQAVYEQQPAFTFPDSVRRIYREQGGSPHLDGEYTVFGQVIEGLEVIDAIANVATGERDMPLEKVEILGVDIVSKPKIK